MRRRRWPLVLAAAVLLMLGLALAGGPEGVIARLLPRPSAGAFGEVREHSDGDLEAALRRTIAGSPGNVSVSVLDLRSGRSADVRADVAMPAASLFKLPLLAAVLDAEREGAIRPEQRLTIQQSQWTDGAGVLQARVGDQLSVQELTRLMIQQSDNIAARVLLDEVGAERANVLALSLGLTETHLADRESGEGGDHLTTARDMRTLLVKLAQGRVGDARRSEDGLRLLELPQAERWVAEGLPGWVRVAHKWGAVPGYQHDAALVNTPRSTFAVVVMTECMGEAQAAATISRVSRAAFDMLGA